MLSLWWLVRGYDRSIHPEEAGDDQCSAGLGPPAAAAPEQLPPLTIPGREAPGQPRQQGKGEVAVSQLCEQE